MYIHPQRQNFFQELEAKLIASPDILKTHYLVSHRDGSFSFQKKHCWLYRLISVYIFCISYDVGAHIERIVSLSQSKVKSPKSSQASPEELASAIRTTRKIFNFFLEKKPHSFSLSSSDRDFHRNRLHRIEKEWVEEAARGANISTLTFAVTHALFEQAIDYLADSDAKSVIACHGRALLQAALRGGNDTAVLVLLTHNVSLDGIQIDKSAYLDKAYQVQNYEAAFRLLAEGVQFSKKFSFFPRLYQKAYETLLERAYEASRFTVCYRLIECDVNIHATGVDKSELLRHAIDDNEQYAVVWLINKGSPIPEADFNPTLYIQAAESYGLHDAVIALVKAGADISLLREKRHYLRYAIEKSCDQDAALLFLRRDDLEIDTPFKSDGKTFLHLASYHGLEAVVEKLLARGASVNIQTKNGDLPLHLAARQANAQVAKKLLGAKTNLTIKNHKEQSPLLVPLQEMPYTQDAQNFYCALFHGYPKICERIRDHGLCDFIPFIERLGTIEPRAAFQVAVLLQNEALAKNATQRITYNEFLKEVDDLEQCFSPQSCNVVKCAPYAVSDGHYRKGLSDLAIAQPPKRVSLQGLLHHYDKLNFTDSGHPHYFNLQPLSGDVRDPEPASVRSKLREMIRKIEAQEEFLGTPKKNTPAIQEFYRAICHGLEHVLIKLDELQQENDPKYAENLKKVMDTLCRTMGYCGGRYYSQCTRLYQIVCKNITLDFSDEVYDTLRSLREIIMQTSIPHDDHNIHDYNHVLQKLGIQYNLPGAKAMQSFDDPYGHHLDFAEIQRRFHRNYTSEVIFNECRQRLKAEGELRNQFIDWCILNIPKTWQQKHFDMIEKAALEMERRGESFEAIQGYLDSQGVMITSGQKIQNAVFEEKKSAFLGTRIFNMESGEIKDTAVLWMLSKLGILTTSYSDEEPTIFERVVGGFTRLVSGFLRTFG